MNWHVSSIIRGYFSWHYSSEVPKPLLSRPCPQLPERSVKTGGDLLENGIIIGLGPKHFRNPRGFLSIRRTAFPPVEEVPVLNNWSGPFGLSPV